MRRIAAFFLVVALCAVPVGFGGLDPELATYARVVFFGAMAVAVGLLAGGSRRERRNA